MRNPVAGEWLRARWERIGLSAAGISRSANISRSTLERVAAGGRVTLRTATALAGPLKLPQAAVSALCRPGITAAELDALARVLALLVAIAVG